VNMTELDPALRKLRLSGMAEHLEMRLLEAQKGDWPAIDLLSALVQDELQRRQDRLLARRIQQARFRDANKTLDSFDFRFNPKIDRALV
jgi:DNA replication protein DnaC